MLPLLLVLCTLWPSVSFAGPQAGAQEVVSFAGDDWAGSGLATEVTVSDVKTSVQSVIVEYGDATPDQGVAIGGDDGGTFRPIAVDSGGVVQVNIASEGAGLATESTLKNVETYTNAARIILQATGASSQQVNGAYAVGDSYTGVRGFPMMFRDLSGTMQVSFCNLVAPGFCLQYVQPADSDFEQVDFTAAGESYNLVASTDGTKANATYIDLDANKHVPVVGDVAHDSADSGAPVKTGGVSYAFTAWDDADPGQTAVSANGDRVQQQLSSKGWNIDQKVGRYVSLDDIEDTYDDVTTTKTSGEIDLGHYRWLSLAFTIEESGTATDLTFTLEVSTDGGTYVEYSNGFAQALVFTDNLIAAAGVLSRSYVFNIAPFKYARIKVNAAGTTASDTFTITYASAGLSN